jgi:hypothetical protein
MPFGVDYSVYHPANVEEARVHFTLHKGMANCPKVPSLMDGYP